jgi:hypothetical protein
MTKQHLHTYKRDRKKKHLFRCIDPDCTHYTYKHLLEGNRAACNDCHGEMILSVYNLKTARPKCDNCAKHKKAREFQTIKQMSEITNLFNPIEMEPPK